MLMMSNIINIYSMEKKSGSNISSDSSNISSDSSNISHTNIFFQCTSDPMVEIKNSKYKLKEQTDKINKKLKKVGKLKKNQQIKTSNEKSIIIQELEEKQSNLENEINKINKKIHKIDQLQKEKKEINILYKYNMINYLEKELKMLKLKQSSKYLDNPEINYSEYISIKENLENKIKYKVSEQKSDEQLKHEFNIESSDDEYYLNEITKMEKCNIFEINSLQNLLKDLEFEIFLYEQDLMKSYQIHYLYDLSSLQDCEELIKRIIYKIGTCNNEIKNINKHLYKYVYYDKSIENIKSWYKKNVLILEKYNQKIVDVLHTIKKDVNIKYLSENFKNKLCKFLIFIENVQDLKEDITNFEKKLYNFLKEKSKLDEYQKKINSKNKKALDNIGEFVMLTRGNIDFIENNKNIIFNIISDIKNNKKVLEGMNNYCVEEEKINKLEKQLKDLNEKHDGSNDFEYIQEKKAIENELDKLYANLSTSKVKEKMEIVNQIINIKNNTTIQLEEQEEKDDIKILTTTILEKQSLMDNFKKDNYYIIKKKCWLYKKEQNLQSKKSDILSEIIKNTKIINKNSEKDK